MQKRAGCRWANKCGFMASDVGSLNWDLMAWKRESSKMAQINSQEHILRVTAKRQWLTGESGMIGVDEGSAVNHGIRP